MTITREDIDQHKIDLSAITTGQKLAPVHPGEILRDEFLKPWSLSVYKFAKAINVPRSRANDLVRGRRAITLDTAFRLARYFGTTPEFWRNLQTRYDLETARDLRQRIGQEVVPLPH